MQIIFLTIAIGIISVIIYYAVELLREAGGWNKLERSSKFILIVFGVIFLMNLFQLIIILI